ncbi:MAG: mechanosensitive ion channel family protein [Bacteroidota bacterium]
MPFPSAPQDAGAAPELSTQLNTATQTVLDKVAGWLDSAIAMLPNLVVAILVIVVFSLAARGLRHVVGRVMGRISDNKQVNALLGTVSYTAVLLVGVFVALGVLQLEKTVTSLLAGVGILGLALGFAFQDIAANFVSGVLLAFRRPFQEGDLVKTNDLFGQVERVTLRSTLLRDLSGQTVVIPNKDVFSNPIINYSMGGARRVEVSVGVSYSDDLEEARRVALAAVDEIPGRLTDRPAELFYEEFGGSSINFVVRFWIDFAKSQADYLTARSEAIIRIKRAFDEHHISIPFPIRTLDLGDNLRPFKEVFAPRVAQGDSLNANA